MMFKRAAIIIALLGAVGAAGSGQTQWLEDGMDAVRQIGSVLPEGWQNLLPEAEKHSNRKNVRKSVSKPAYSGRVVSVSDGDTLHVTDSDGLKHKIRLAYIDAPELQQSYGTRSHQNLRRAAEGGNVDVTVFETDRYGREVAQVKRDGEDLNLRQIRDGAAWHYEIYAKKQQARGDYAAYAAAQAAAKQNRTGLWSKRDPQTPWAYRRARRETQNSREAAWPDWHQIWENMR